MGLDIHMQHLCLKLESILLIHQKRLGHASSQMTLDVYTHTTKTGEKNSIDKFADYLNKAK